MVIPFFWYKINKVGLLFKGQSYLPIHVPNVPIVRLTAPGPGKPGVRETTLTLENSTRYLRKSNANTFKPPGSDPKSTGYSPHLYVDGGKRAQ